MTILEAIFEYLSHLEAEGCAPSTLYNYRLDLMRSARFLAPLGVSVVENLTADTLSILAASWAERSPASRSRYGSAVRGFLKFLHGQGRVTADAYAAIPKENVRPMIYTVPQASTLRQVVEVAPMGTRDRALLELLALGVTPTECAMLTLADFDAAEGQVRVGTSTRARRIDLPAVAWVALAEYLKADRTKYAVPGAAGLFLNYAGISISRMVPWVALRQASDLVGVAVTARMLKAARVSTLLKNNVSPGQVAREVGLTCVDSALRYKTTVEEDAA